MKDENVLAEPLRMPPSRGQWWNRQPLPKGGQEIVGDYVLTDIRKRIEMGYEKYGTLLKTHNGRDALWDAYEEALDLVFYLRQAILERGDKNG